MNIICYNIRCEATFHKREIIMPDITQYNTLIAYLLARLRSTTLYATLDRILKYGRRFLFVSRILKYIGIAAAIIETSAVLILTAAAVIVLIPIMAAILAIFFVSDVIISGRILKSKSLADYLSRERIYVILCAGRFGEDFAKKLANEGAAVFLVTADPKKQFISAKDRDGVYYIRHAFFFRLKRKILKGVKDKLIYLL